MFVQRMNAQTGELEWADAAHAADDVADAVAGSSYLDMLNDAARNEAFAAAISETASGRSVLDIGTGTGLLALLAAAAGASIVTACEVFPPMVATARQVATANVARGGDRVRVVPKRSSDLTVGPTGDMAERADVLVFEVLDSELLGEGVLPTLRDARARLLAPGARVVPARARVCAALVECDALRRCHALPADVAGPAAAPGSVCTLAPLHALHLTAFGDQLRVLTLPAEVLLFDFDAADAQLPPESGAAGTLLRLAASAAGTAHAVAVWWDLDVDAAGSARYSTAPSWARPCDLPAAAWTHHWRQCVAFLPGAGIPLAAGQPLALRACHDDHSLWFHVHVGTDDVAGLGPTQPPADPAHAARLGSRERVWQLSDEVYASVLRAAGAHAVARAVPEDGAARVAVLGDGTLLALLAATVPRAAAVTALVSQPEQLTVVARAVARRNDAAAAPVHAALASRFLHSDDNDASAKQAPLRQDAFDVALAEPYYTLLDSAVPWAAACRLWRDVSALRRGGWLAQGAPVAPARAVLRARLAALPALWRTRAAVGDVCGVDVAAANVLLRPPCGGDGADASSTMQHLAPAFPVSLFQCSNGGSAAPAPPLFLSFPATLAAMQLAAADWAPQAGEALLRADAAGNADALLLWVSYGESENDGAPADDDAVWSSAPRLQPGGTALKPCYRRQGVALLRAPWRVRPGDALRVAWELDNEDELTLSVRLDSAR